MTTAQDLVERLEKATGPTLELDGMVWCAVNGYEFVQWDGAGCVYKHPNAPNWDRGIKHVLASIVRPYTTSLDATVALVERVLPDWEWQAGDDAHFGKYGAVYRSLSEGGDGFSEEDMVSAATPTIALLIAMFKSLASRPNKEDRNG